MGGSGINSSGPGQGPAVGYYEHGKKQIKPRWNEIPHMDCIFISEFHSKIYRII
jgi:hypothetical protein